MRRGLTVGSEQELPGPPPLAPRDYHGLGADARQGVRIFIGEPLGFSPILGVEQRDPADDRDPIIPQQRARGQYPVTLGPQMIPVALPDALAGRSHVLVVNG